MTSTINVRTLSMNITYGGAAGLNEEIVIDTITLYYNGEKVTNHLSNPVEINGPTRIVIPISDDEDEFKYLRIEQ